MDKLIKVPPLYCSDIKRGAEQILMAYQPSALADIPTDIERFYTVIIPNKMGMITGSDDLSCYGADVLGVTEAARKTSFVSSVLYDSVRPVDQRRCRATMAHEAGHCVHHVTYARFASMTGTGSLFRRAADLKTYENPEWQAWEFARQLLMPEKAVRQCMADGYSTSDMVTRFNVNRSFVENWCYLLQQRDNRVKARGYKSKN